MPTPWPGRGRRRPPGHRARNEAPCARAARYLPCCKTVRIPVLPPPTPARRDRFDVLFLQLALAGKADALITGDRDLLSLAGVFACPIVSTEQFIKSLAA